MNRDEIKACPFCGKPAKVEIRTRNEKDYYAIGCDNVACRGSAWAGDPDAVRALSRWNERAGDRKPAASKTAETKHVGISEWLDAIKRQLYNRAADLKVEMGNAQTPSQKSCLATTILIADAIAGAIHDAQNEMASNVSS